MAPLDRKAFARWRAQAHPTLAMGARNLEGGIAAGHPARWA
ncbi:MULTISPECIES: hypothetical protein [Thermus]|nr:MULTISPECIES: hypothetical protein [Thermus]